MPISLSVLLSGGITLTQVS